MFIRASSLCKSTNRLISRFMSTSLLADRQAAIARLEAKTYFEQLSKSEKLYAHYMSKAAFAGSRIILAQVNPRSPDIYDFLMTVFTTEQGKMANIDKLHKDRYVVHTALFGFFFFVYSIVPAKFYLIDFFEFSGLSQDAFDDFLQYSAQFLGNMGNYRSFGDRKFIPRLSAEDIDRIVDVSAQREKATKLWQNTKDEIFGIEPSAKTLLGYYEDGHVSGYYSSNVTKAEITLVQNYCESIGLDVLNTRYLKLQ